MAIKETDLYIPLKRFFNANGFEVYEEVSVPYCGGRVDLVANNFPAPIAIEMKTTLNMDLIEQAMDRKHVFPYVYIAIPLGKRRKVPRWVINHLRQNKIGLIFVSDSGHIHMAFAARYDKAPMRDRVEWEKLLRPEHQGWVEAGTAGGGYVTPYKITMLGVKKFLQRKADWVSMNDILEHCETHYMTPKPSLSRALLEFETGWVEARKVKNRWQFRYKEGGST